MAPKGTRQLSVSAQAITFLDGVSKPEVVSMAHFMSAFFTHNAFLTQGIIPPGLRFLSDDYVRDDGLGVDVAFEVPPNLRTIYSRQGNFDFFTPWMFFTATLMRKDGRIRFLPTTKLFVNSTQIYSPFSELHIPTPYAVDDKGSVIGVGFYEALNQALGKTKTVLLEDVYNIVRSQLLDFDNINLDHPDMVKLIEMYRDKFPATGGLKSLGRFDPRKSDEKFAYDLSHLPTAVVSDILDSLPCHTQTKSPAKSMYDFLYSFMKRP